MVAPAPRRLRRFFRPPTVLQWNHEKVFPTFYQTSKPITPKALTGKDSGSALPKKQPKINNENKKQYHDAKRKVKYGKFEGFFFLQNYCTQNQLQSSAQNAANNLVCCWGKHWFVVRKARILHFQHVYHPSQRWGLTSIPESHDPRESGLTGRCVKRQSMGRGAQWGLGVAGPAFFSRAKTHKMKIVTNHSTARFFVFIPGSFRLTYRIGSPVVIRYGFSRRKVQKHNIINSLGTFCPGQRSNPNPVTHTAPMC